MADDHATPARTTPPVATHLSFSALSDFTHCGKAFQLYRVLGLEGAPGYARAGGTAVHAATEAYDRKRFALLGS